MTLTAESTTICLFVPLVALFSLNGLYTNSCDVMYVGLCSPF